MTGKKPDLLNEFKRRLEGMPQRARGSAADLLLEVMDPAAAKLLRLCAIPHHFNSETVGILAPELGDDEIHRRCEEFTRLSFVSADGDDIALQDGLRRHLFLQWLKQEPITEFKTASERLAAYFKQQADRLSGEQSEIAQRRRMFHLLGADLEFGFERFQLLFRRARHNRLYSECSQLVAMVHEYDSFLTPRFRLWLTYQEAKLLADLRDFEDAEIGFRRVLDDPEAPPDLRSLAYVRLGYAYNARHNWDEAIRHYQRGLSLAQSTEKMKHTLPRITHDLGAAYRDLGDLLRAEEYLNRSVELAEEQRNLSSMALAYNSLGTLALKRREVHAAIEAFEKSLDALLRNNEELRTAQVYNNLGLAYADLPDWKRSEEYYQRSLEIKMKAGDTLGQATALSNLARVNASMDNVKQAIDNATRAIELFTEMHDRFNSALVKHNRGKLFRRMDEPSRARKDFTEAREAYRALQKFAEADSVARDLEALDAKRGLPWWAWGSIVVTILIFLLLVVAIAFG